MADDTKSLDHLIPFVLVIHLSWQVVLTGLSVQP